MLLRVAGRAFLVKRAQGGRSDLQVQVEFLVSYALQSHPCWPEVGVLCSSSAFQGTLGNLSWGVWAFESVLLIVPSNHSSLNDM